MTDLRRSTIEPALSKIFTGIAELAATFPPRRFTIDGRLVGDIGEVVAELAYDLVLDAISQPEHDATTPDGKRVQIKATFQDALTFKTIPEIYLGIKLYPDGSFEEIFNGPGQLIHDAYSEKRPSIGTELLRFKNSRWREISEGISEHQRVAVRNNRLE